MTLQILFHQSLNKSGVCATSELLVIRSRRHQNVWRSYLFNSAGQFVTKCSGACISSSAWFTRRRFPSEETSNDDQIPGVLAWNKRWGLPTATSDPFALIGHAKKSSV